MKHDQSFQILFLTSFLSFLCFSGDVFAYKESDFYKLKNTKKCIECDLTDLNLSRVNLRRVNLSGSDLSGSDLSGSDLSGSDLSGVNLSRVNLNGTNLGNINLTGANLNRIIIDTKALSTLDLSESTFLNKSTLAKEKKKEKEQALRKKKQKLRKKKKRTIRKKKEIGLSEKKEQASRKQDVDEKSVFVQSDKKCYVAVQSSIDFEHSLLSIISISLISKFVNEVEQVPSGGIPTDSCQYKISVTKSNNTTIVTFRGEGLNSYGDSKLSGLNGFQQSILKSLYRSLKNKRGLICQDYGTLLEECAGVKFKKKQNRVLLEAWVKSSLNSSLIQYH